MAQWLACLTCYWWIPVRLEFEPQQRLPSFLSARKVTNFSVPIGSRNGFECDLHKQIHTKMNEYKILLKFTTCIEITVKEKVNGLRPAVTTTKYKHCINQYPDAHS